MINLNENMGPGRDCTRFSVHIYHCLCCLYLLFAYLFTFSVCLFCSHLLLAVLITFTVSFAVHTYCAFAIPIYCWLLALLFTFTIGFAVHTY